MILHFWIITRKCSPGWGFRKVNRQSKLTGYNSFNGKVWRVWPECGNKFSKIDKKGDVT